MRETKPTNNYPSNKYKYVIECKSMQITLTVDNNDIIHNADGDIDCPLETVLRKNHFTLYELKKWGLVSIHFVEIANEEETIRNQIECETVLQSIKF
ncbi:hypothetical protein SAMN04488569_100122 [Marinilactibacillus piezotolerans]|uniref:Uncharacterized protein n=1 Tax=Marinilactibacillus piezotolerans TaxID=258723 RepID=A0A1I3UKG6_9LACT|nr:hypothetical protein [Marinilactibacillus piezotolerans]SFJ83193.1 hypothetical protein SAMN04488569_100122 [Marinilactibacillus piezotolerans]